MANPKGDFQGGGPKGKKGFPMNDAKHQRLAIGGATRSYNAGNISKSKENSLKRPLAENSELVNRLGSHSSA